MLRHSSLDDIEYSKYSYSTRQAIKKRHRRRHHSHSHSQSKRRPRLNSNFAVDKCAVCLDSTTTLDTKLFPCGHTFHGQCLIQWVTIQKGRKFNCPLCRQDIAHFIQMTGNTQINQQLIEIWNEHYLYNNNHQSKSDEHAFSKLDADKTSKCNQCTIKETQADQRTDTTTQLAHVSVVDDKDPLIQPVEFKQDDVEKSDHSLWKFIWKSPQSVLYPIQCIMDNYASYMTTNSVLYPIYDDIYHDDEHIDNDQYNTYHIDLDGFEQIKRGKYYDNLYRDDNEPQIQQREDGVNKYKDTDTDKVDNIVDNESNLDLLTFSVLNFKSGILAGLCAGSTTFLWTQQVRQQLLHQRFANIALLRTSLLPILSETIPSVAIFFTSYEHLKKYLFSIDNQNTPNHQIYAQRFISAGIASSLSYWIPSHQVVNRGLLPFRFATFFGTFELCKDAMNRKHEELNLVQVASSAAIGGTISHGLYYPLTQCKDAFILSTANGGNLNLNAMGVLSRGLYKGWMSSLTKFLPSCIVCSCAFEYSKRYLS